MNCNTYILIGYNILVISLLIYMILSVDRRIKFLKEIEKHLDATEKFIKALKDTNQKGKIDE